jgi:hypothetical protein
VLDTTTASLRRVRRSEAGVVVHETAAVFSRSGPLIQGWRGRSRDGGVVVLDAAATSSRWGPSIRGQGCRSRDGVVVVKAGAVALDAASSCLMQRRCARGGFVDPRQWPRL